jgi:hypothetical protein
MDADVGSTTPGPSVVTGAGCTATGRTTAMTHASTLNDLGGWLGWNFTVANGPATALVLLGIGRTNPNLQVPGLCANVFTDLLLTIPIGVTDAAGAITTQTAGASSFVLRNTLQSATIYTQAFAADAGQPGLPVAASDGRMTTVPTSNLTRVCDVMRLFNDVGGTTATQGNFWATLSVGYALPTQFTY